MKLPIFKVLFDRKHEATKEKTGLVQIEVYYSGKRKWIGTGVKIYAGQWKDNQMVYNRADAISLNDQINNMLISMRDWSNSLAKSGEPFSFEKLDKMLEVSSSEASFLDFVEKRISLRKIKDSTKKKDYGMLKVLEEFGIIKEFEDLTTKNIKSWDDYIKNRVRSNTTVHDYHKRLKVFVREAYQFDYIKRNPYEGFKVVRPDTTVRKFLTADELKRIEGANIEMKSVSDARDCFVFCCYTGLSYADLADFDYKKDVVLKDGKCYIIDERIKTGSHYNIMILSPAMNILKKHDYKLPVITNQQYNRILKVVGMYAKLDKSLTSHMARHTFATWALSQGIRIETVSKMLAHSDIKTTQIYAKILQQEVSSAFDSLEEKVKK